MNGEIRPDKMFFEAAVTSNIPGPIGSQTAFCALINELRTHAFYFEFYAVASERNKRLVNLLLALTSSGSIAAWAIWKEYSFAWAAIIALAQVAAVAKPYLPYRQRAKFISELQDRIELLGSDCEKIGSGVVWLEPVLHPTTCERIPCFLETEFLVCSPCRLFFSFVPSMHFTPRT